MDKDMDKDIYKLNTHLFNSFMINSLNESIKKNYKINGEINFYNPNLKLITNYFKKPKGFTHKHKLIRLLKKQNRVENIGFFYRSLIKYRNKTYFKNIFMKEIPLIDIQLLNLLKENDLTNNIYDINDIQDKLGSEIYNINSQSNVEIFVTYLTSRLYELDLSPNFCSYYGHYLVNLKKFTYNVEDDKHIDMNNINIYYPQDDDDDLINIECKNVPVYLLAVEKINFDIDILKRYNKIDQGLLLSIIFQIYSSIVIMNKTYGIKHNDLHIGNIMLQKTYQKYLYYKLDTKFYKVPTQGFILKIIDWGRSSYKIGEFNGQNSIYNRENECYGQYIFNRLGPKKKPITIEKNKWSDIVMVSHSLLYEFPEFINTRIGSFLLKVIEDKNGDMLDPSTFDWSIYTKINKYDYVIKPRNIFKNKIFNKYIIQDKNIIPEKSIIYNIY